MTRASVTYRTATGIGDLPDILPIFPLPQVIVLPRVNLPLNIFEPRYLAMVDHALAAHRMIGVIQPRVDGICTTGCAGRITSFQETPDGRYLISLHGVCRFNIASEDAPHNGGFRLIHPDWTPFAGDFAINKSDDICRDMITGLLRLYFEKMQIACDQWEQIRNMPCDTLISTLSVICPFGTDEKQALLEAPTLQDRIRILKSLIENAITSNDGKAATTCH